MIIVAKKIEACGLLISIFIMAISVGHNNLDYLWKKKLRYEHHQLNFDTSLRDDIVPDGLRITKRPGIAPVTTDFDSKWQHILKTAEIKLVSLLSEEAAHVIVELEKKFDETLNVVHNNGGEGRLKEDFIRQKFRVSLETRTARKRKYRRTV